MGPCILLSGGSAAGIATRNFTGSLRMTARLIGMRGEGQVPILFLPGTGRWQGAALTEGGFGKDLPRGDPPPPCCAWSPSPYRGG